ncbi:acyl-CoA thioesterase/bile acid-CoA:amino acid N-acyltransferase family protein [Streptomyces sp. NBC_00385]|uniref:acyl-CoA thioesterase/bile acid-CoA:amino acid N-acyltransferase family protein n=1 Tax=Streptomyces sp. NBC_00385 TaxID=2975733 RepID=UPI002DDC2D9B|nr:acyl-CoA thioesterase/bile acid-CoA:amino acid N-acyltransferase family protein [Streptomyces sp. NBC_00385]WRZ02096.1 acyl-CoA thioesterase/BAAT N-terminal domain-containing protein [Streptomyces sp. NBC_00385]
MRTKDVNGRATGWRYRAVAVACCLTLSGAGACSSGPQHSTRASIQVDRAESLADGAVRVRVSGLRPNEEVTLTAGAADYRGAPWASQAVVTADDAGTVDLNRARSRSGTYRGVDGMGLFWSMTPQQKGAGKETFASKPPEQQASFKVTLAVKAGGKRIATRSLTRTWMSEGTTYQALRGDRNGLYGALYLPAPHSPRRAPVLTIGGSEGGTSNRLAAALLASHGHPVLALCYFGCPGRPESLENIKLEYFATAARFLDRQYGTKSAKPAVIGVSRGTEAAQLLAHAYPGLVGDVVLYAPSRNTTPGFPHGIAWTRNDKPVDLTPIPLDDVKGSVLAIAGDDDRLWQSADAARSIGDDQSGPGSRREALVYKKAGHAIGWYPYSPSARYAMNRMSNRYMDLGGTSAGNAHAQADGWPRVLRLLGE